MKLIAQYNRINIIAILFVLMGGSFCYYFIIQRVLIAQLDDSLKVEEQEIINYVNKYHHLPDSSTYKGQLTSFVLVPHPVKKRFFSTDVYDPADREYKSRRVLLFPLSLGPKQYAVSVSKSQIETEDLLTLIVMITLGAVILLLLILFVVNRLIVKRLWQPFYQTLQSIQEFDLYNRKPAQTIDTSIEEFQQLNVAIVDMTAKAIRDYDTLKNFSENASHEMQTPLAIINSKLDLIIQDHGLDEKLMKQVQGMYDAVGRLTKLNQSLLLLAKIGNNQFVAAEQIRLEDLISEKLFQLEELVAAKHIRIETHLQHTPVRMNRYLADMLLSNLLSNAIRHNVDGGKITIQLDTATMTICNSGPTLPFDAALIFDRFQKSDFSEGTGLGLAIAKQICDNYHFRISYSHRDDLHFFTIWF